jgi:hypothetical protein
VQHGMAAAANEGATVYGLAYAVDATGWRMEQGGRIARCATRQGWVKSHFCQSKHIGGAICEAAIAADQGAWHDIEGPAATR